MVTCAQRSKSFHWGVMAGLQVAVFVACCTNINQNMYVASHESGAAAFKLLIWNLMQVKAICPVLTVYWSYLSFDFFWYWV